VYGLVYGVLIGSALFFLIQIPALIAYQFKWVPSFDIHNPDVRKILVMLGPRVAGMFFYQLTFIARDNIASHLTQGAVNSSDLWVDDPAGAGNANWYRSWYSSFTNHFGAIRKGRI